MLGAKNVKDITEFSAFPPEEEGLLRPLTFYKVINAERDVPHDKVWLQMLQIAPPRSIRAVSDAKEAVVRHAFAEGEINLFGLDPELPHQCTKQYLYSRITGILSSKNEVQESWRPESCAFQLHLVKGSDLEFQLSSSAVMESFFQEKNWMFLGKDWHQRRFLGLTKGLQEMYH